MTSTQNQPQGGARGHQTGEAVAPAPTVADYELAFYRALEPLNERQRSFVHEYMVCKTYTQAAINAGYSEHTAGRYGYQLLQRDVVRDAIRAGQAYHNAISIMEQRELLEVLNNHTRGNIRDYFATLGGRNAELQDLEALTDEQWARVQEVSVTSNGVKVKMYNPKDSIALIAKMTGQESPQRHEISGLGGAPLVPDDQEVRITFVNAPAQEAPVRMRKPPKEANALENRPVDIYEEEEDDPDE